MFAPGPGMSSIQRYTTICKSILIWLNILLKQGETVAFAMAA